MKTISQNELLKIISESKGAIPVGLFSVTDARARKTGNPYGKIFKLCRAVGFVGANYQRAVENEAARQGENASEFQAESLPWGNWLIQNKVIEHKGELYLRTQTAPGQRRKQPARVTGYLSESLQILSREQVKPFLPESRESSKQQDEAGLSETVWVRTYKFNSIKKIRINGKTYWLKN